MPLKKPANLGLKSERVEEPTDLKSERVEEPADLKSERVEEPTGLKSERVEEPTDLKSERVEEPTPQALGGLVTYYDAPAPAYTAPSQPAEVYKIVVSGEVASGTMGTRRRCGVTFGQQPTYLRGPLPLSLLNDPHLRAKLLTPEEVAQISPAAIELVEG